MIILFEIQLVFINFILKNNNLKNNKNETVKFIKIILIIILWKSLTKI